MAKNRDVMLLKRAVEAARSSTYRWQHGAVIAQGNRILAVRPNVFRNSPWHCPEDATVHAEQAALKGRYRQAR